VTALHELTALEQAAAMRAGELSPVELCEHYLARAQRLNDDVGAYVTLAAELALEQARAAQRRLSERAEGLGALHGVPVPVKDLEPVAGVRCTYGSAAFADHVPDADGRAARLLREAGTVMLGKTTTPELGLTAWTESAVAPTARTPFDLTRSASGSSGGAAAAVAAGLAPVAHGTDGGGSVRTPASACGLVGLKPGRGVVSDGPAEGAAGLASSGAIGRTVRDAAALLDVLAARDPGAERVPGPPSGGFLTAADREPGRLRIGRFCTPPLADVPVAPAVLAGYEETSALLAELGHEIVDVAPPFSPAEAVDFDPVWSVLGGLAEVPAEREALLAPITRWHRRQAHGVSGLAYARAVAALQRIAYDARARLSSFDAVLAPTLAQPPVPVGALRDDDDPARGFAAEKAFSPFSAPWNVLGLPAVSLPLCWASVDASPVLPIGMTLAGRSGEDAHLVGLAAQLEAARPWAERRAPLLAAS
jgi:amidase